MDKFILSYNGNKYIESKKYLKNIIEDNKDIQILAEPFCGIFGFSRCFYYLNDNKDILYWLNDINNDLITFYKKLKIDFEGAINEVENELNKYDKNFDMTNDKNKSYILNCICRNHNERFCNIDKGKTKIKNFRSKKIEYMCFLEKCEFFNMDCNDFLKLIPIEKKALIYFDPPYFNSNNKMYCDNFKEGEDYHDGTYIYLNILESFKNKNNNHKKLFVLNKIDIINYLFKEFYYLEYSGSYCNTIVNKINNTKKNVKKHIIYYD